MNCNIELELFKPVTIEGYEHYWVSNQGRVLNSRTGHFLKPSLNHGYHQVLLSSAGDRITRRVHRLVGLTWIPNPDNKKTINHIDGRKTNNNVDNLEWATHQENMQHAFETGLFEVYHGDKLLTEKEKIKGMLLNDLTYVDIAKVYDCNRSTIRRFAIDNNLRESKKYANRVTITNNQVQEVYVLLTEGKSLNSIVKSLDVNYNTVRRHLNKLYGKDHIDEVMLIKIN